MKQVIVVRKDLNMRKGKMIAQGCHASVTVVLSRHLDRIIRHTWMTEGQTKICVGVNSELELCMAYERAIASGIPCSLITDAGHTEFKGVPTRTAVAIGPWHDEEIDKITGKLSLL